MDPRNLNSLFKENVGDEGQNSVEDSRLMWGEEESRPELKAGDKEENSKATELLGSKVKEDKLSKLVNETDYSTNNAGKELISKFSNELS
ncbi:hypothetical protein O181_009187 [Austropuccinia psidii MF-1]|uniref:Uncharacterized protein n=1 Tax=Austropuccinia psidii MF-1 TaxID=1389203 RepID=A0A9Q3BR86_9BASI|nr:hypothetical protein [Austropuccinia psidii MF-1]